MTAPSNLPYQPKVSLLVAAYNIEDYIDKCLSSLVNQTLKDIEIIVVNDGSTDNTLENITLFATTDKRIKIINQENQGLSEVRRIGFQAARGDYVQFVDGDDWLALDACQKLYHQAQKDQADVVLSHYKEIDPDGHTNYSYGFIQKQRYLHPFKEYAMGNYGQSICIKFIRRKFVSDTNFSFPIKITHGEDCAFSALFFLQNPQMSFLDTAFYYYRRRLEGASYNLQGYTDDSEKLFSVIEKELENIPANRQLKEYCQFFFLRYLYELHYNALQHKGEETKKNVAKIILKKDIKIPYYLQHRSLKRWFFYQLYNVFPSILFFKLRLSLLLKKYNLR